jgi:hypothetical protein
MRPPVVPEFLQPPQTSGVLQLLVRVLVKHLVHVTVTVTVIAVVVVVVVVVVVLSQLYLLLLLW